MSKRMLVGLLQYMCETSRKRGPIHATYNSKSERFFQWNPKTIKKLTV